ncbi:Ankyrin repeat domain-containing protein 16 [Larimichthys crocea]|uniref:Uncharacterized protein n=1 Tax=Larimichthys crocea TaxID=215358 RepID=A0ACD3Q5X7_LARCR|nr:Ankyrin repeat domain-containing protein 16 [Larimichthys crocea]
MDDNTLKALVKLAQEGQLSSLEEQITSGGSAAAQTVSSKHFGRSGDTLLHYAARHGHLDVVEYLIKRLGMDVEVYNNDYKRPLHEAASMSHQACVSYLLREGAKVDSLKKADWTPLMMACTRRNLDVIQELLHHGADPALRNKDGWNSFHIACREGYPPVIQHLLLVAPDVWRTVSKTRRTPLHTADVATPQTALTAVESLLSWTPSGMDTFLWPGCFWRSTRRLQQQLTESGLSRCTRSLSPGQNEALWFLVRDLNVDVNQRATDMQLTALHYAAKEGHTSSIKTLLELGADLHVRDKKGRSALHMACIGQHADAAQTLMQLGLRDAADASGITARQHAKKQHVVQVFECDSPNAS